MGLHRATQFDQIARGLYRRTQIEVAGLVEEHKIS